MRVDDLFLENTVDDITTLQRELNKRGANLTVDGKLGPKTVIAILTFAPNALPKDLKTKAQGVISPKTKTVSSDSAFNDAVFNTKLNKISRDLGLDDDVLRAIINLESRGRANAKDPFGVSAGLIGFTKRTAANLGTTREEILQMPAVDQLDLVARYYKKIGVKPGMRVGDVYMLTFLPSFVSAPDNYVLGKENGGELMLPSGKGTGISMHKLWYQNPVFARSNGKPSFTVGDVKRKAESHPIPRVEESVSEDTVNPVDTIQLDVPLLLRMMEYAREDAKTDMDLHDVTEKMIHLSKTGETLSMAQYDDIVGDNEEPEPKPTMPGPEPAQQEAMGGSSAEEFLKSVEYRPRHQAKPKRTLMGDPVREGHGRYWCSTDKRWKERQGPKQSRS